MGTLESNEVPSFTVGKRGREVGGPCPEVDNGWARGQLTQKGKCGERKGTGAWDPEWEILARANF